MHEWESPGAWWNNKQSCLRNLALKHESTQDYMTLMLFLHECIPHCASLKHHGTTQSCHSSWKLEENPYHQWNHGEGGSHHSPTNKLCSYRWINPQGPRLKEQPWKTMGTEQSSSCRLLGRKCWQFESRHVNNLTEPLQISHPQKKIVASTVTTEYIKYNVQLPIKNDQACKEAEMFGEKSQYKGTLLPWCLILQTLKLLLYFSKMVVILIDTWVFNLPWVPEISSIWSWKVHIFPSFSWIENYIVFKIGFHIRSYLHGKLQPLRLAFLLQLLRI